MTLEQISNIWLNQKHYTLKQTSYCLYKKLLNYYILPEFGKYKLSKIKTNIIQEYIDKLSKEKKLKPATVVKIFQILKMIINFALEEKMIKYNYCKKIKLPRLEKTSRTPFSSEEQKKLLQKIDDNKYFYIQLALRTGLRIGELCCLKWNDVDLDRGVLNVNKTVSYVDGKMMITNPKSETSNREIYLSAEIIKMFKNYKTYKENKAIKSEYIFSTRTGTVQNPQNIRRQFYTILKKLNLSKNCFHALRHTFATQALEHGADVKTLSEILGHSSVVTTLKIYTHILTPIKILTMNLIDNAFCRHCEVTK